MNFGNMLGGDWNEGMMQGYRMAALMDQRRMQEQRLQQETQNARLINEERAIRIKEQQRQIESRDKLAREISPQTMTKSWDQPDYETGLSSQQTSATTQNSPLFQAISEMYGTDKARLIGSMMASDPDMGVNMLKTLQPKDRFVSVAEGGTLVDANTGNVVFRGNPKPQRPVSVAPGGTLIDPATNQPLFQAPFNPNSGRESPEEAGAKAAARKQAMIDLFTRTMGRRPNQQELRRMFINDPYGILEGDTGDGAEPVAAPVPSTAKAPAGKTRPPLSSFKR